MIDMKMLVHTCVSYIQVTFFIRFLFSYKMKQNDELIRVGKRSDEYKTRKKKK